ncbi:hypothetical protein [Roseibium marinum]|uniref:Uncharacterized protein n=1 Tax=Roseibium marinum TaxID=281252 RepID=A0A2S3UWN0_9HYPH|nr:hypothetical protein [Roseibium marinum]POF32084.1 hypothetical protein CLV41_1033 [Roseibium marinum]
MTFSKTLSASILGGVPVLAFLAAAAIAQDKVDPQASLAVTDGQPGRYSLVAVGDEILRVDRQNGTVSVCVERSDAWRCNPVPLAEDAYLAEINELSEEVDRLAVRIEELESGDVGETKKGSGKLLPPGSALDRPKSSDEGQDQPLKLHDKDDEELDKVLTFTESAMRRFFGMVRELQKDFQGEDEGEGKGN